MINNSIKYCCFLINPSNETDFYRLKTEWGFIGWLAMRKELVLQVNK